MFRPHDPPATTSSYQDRRRARDAAAFASVFASTSPIDAEFDAASLAGQDSVLWFWAPWCTVCRAEAPDINETVERFGADVQIIGVAGRGGIDEMRDFIDDTGEIETFVGGLRADDLADRIEELLAT